VLVIDDDPAVRDTMTRLLRKEGYRAVTAASGEEGLRLARQERPDIITLDVMMPRTDGWAVLAALKADSSLSAIPVIMLTVVDDRNLGYLLGASEYLIKPIDRVRLSALLDKHRPRRSGCRVLVAEDDSGMRRMLRNALRDHGWQVIEAENGGDALKQVAEAPPDLILLDLFMPEMDGFEFATKLRRHEAWRRIPVVILTAKDLGPDERLRLKGNVQKVLHKGAYTSSKLLREIRELMQTCAPPVSQQESLAEGPQAPAG
jgi:CheY-like chemotaxis protein